MNQITWTAPATATYYICLSDGGGAGPFNVMFGANGSEIVKFYYKTGGGPCNTVLPVELLSFTGKISGSGVLLNWETATETNNDYFEIQRKDGMPEDWKNVGTIKGAGNSSTVRSYEFTDPLETLNLKPETVYYRLKQTDFDGRSEYAGTIPVELASPDEWKLFLKNPAGEELQGTLLAPENSEVQLEIFDLQGRILQSEKQNAVKGSTLLQLSIRELNSGIYFLRVNGAGKQLLAKFVKL